jgi:uncharacterized membrane protein
MKEVILILLMTIFLQTAPSILFAAENTNATAVTQEDRERLIRLEVTMKEFKESVDKRFEQVDKRFTELREDMNNRFDQMMNFLWILVTIFAAIMAANIGFAYWDRRTIIKKSTDEAISRIEKEGKLTDLIKALRELASKDQNLADILRKFHLL